MCAAPLTFEVSMNDSPLMNVSECEAELNEPVEDLFLGEELSVLQFDECGEIPSVAVLHDDAQHFPLEEALAIGDDERMMQFAQ
jgi:hypothetical protein